MAALREPIFGDSRSRTELPPREGDVSGDFARTAGELIAPSATLAPAERLELYHRQYWYRLLDSIAEDFPALRRLLGEEPFWRLVEAYLEAAPPTSFTLRHLGAGLADFIAARPASVALPVHAEELARLEYALCHAFEAGEEPPVEPGALAQGALALQPHLGLLALRTPADTQWRRRGRAAGPPPSPHRPGARPSRFVVIYRDEAGLRVERLPRAAYVLLAAIQAEGSLDAAMGRVAEERGLLRARDAARVRDWFATWSGRRWFIRPRP